MSKHLAFENHEHIDSGTQLLQDIFKIIKKSGKSYRLISNVQSYSKVSKSHASTSLLKQCTIEHVQRRY